MQATYTKEQDVKLIRLFKEGKKASEVAKAIGKTRNSVIGRKYRLKMCEKKERKLESSEPRFGAVKKFHASQKKARELGTKIRSCKKVPCFPEEGLCKWPIGDVGAEDFYFCSAPVDGLSVYCNECRKKAYDVKRSKLQAKTEDKHLLFPNDSLWYR